MTEHRHPWSFLLNISILALFLAGSYIVIARQPGLPPTPEPLPTFGMSPELRERVDVAAAGNGSAFTCPPYSDMGPAEVATCTDCMLFPVSRIHALPAGYTPPLLVDSKLPGGGRLRPEANAALTTLFEAAKAEGHLPRITSAYRSYTEQYETFLSWVSFEKQKNLTEAQAISRASRYSARPGHSEHQLGTAVDVNCASCPPFATGNAQNKALWAFFEQNAHLFGFVISYPRGVEALTGYQYEPWHLRYIGVEHATRLYEAGYLEASGVCLVNFLLVQDQP